jgi:hypothetical protein
MQGKEKDSEQKCFDCIQIFIFLNKKLKTMILNNKTWHILDTFFLKMAYNKFGLPSSVVRLSSTFILFLTILSSLQTCLTKNHCLFTGSFTLREYSTTT